MPEGIAVTVGRADADLVGEDNRALQAAVDYAAGLGGGVVLVGPGTYLMRDSLHLRSGVTICGHGPETVLRKADAVESPLVLDGDYGEQQITVADPSGFGPGVGVAVKDDRAGGFHVAVRTIVAADGSTFRLDGPLLADYMVASGAVAQTVYPVVSGYYVAGARVERLAVDGNRAHNPPLTGCRGAGIFLYRSPGCVVADCLVRDYSGDGISFQQSDDVRIERCECAGNSALGLHPGSGSQRPVVVDCHSHHNGQIGLFLCWRVRHGRFERNTLDHNGRAGISIGHKDTDNLFVENVVSGNGWYGVLFRDEAEPMAGHRNRFVGCRIVDNGSPERAGIGVRIEGATRDLSLEICVVGDTRPAGERTQAVGVSVGPRAGPIVLRGVDLRGNARAEVESEAGPEALIRLGR